MRPRIRLAAPGAAFLVAASLLIAALAPLWLTTHGSGLATLALFAFFSKLCHQQPARSLVVLGAPAAVCMRCLGIYAGAALGTLLRTLQPLALRCLAAALLLNAADVAAESIGLHGNMPLPRLLIGASLGLAVGAVFSTHEGSARLSLPT